jgi:hypothetical protein
MNAYPIQRQRRAAGQEGVALLTTLLLMMVMTVIGIASLTVTGVENRIASFVRAGEAASVAAESCLNVAVHAIEFTIRDSKVPDALLDSATPAGPVPAANGADLLKEILGAAGYENYGDALPGTYPNFNIGLPTPALTMNNFVVQGDIDRLHSKAGAGSSTLMIQGYEGLGSGSAAGGTEILYQITCLARNSSSNIQSRIKAVYACKPVADGCLRKI